MAEKTDEAQPTDLEAIELSTYTQDLIRHYHQLWHHTRKYSGDFIEVSDAASFLAQIYEKMRNSVEFSEQHLIRRSAIIRILRRRLSKNQTGKGEGITILKELLWGRYLSKSTMTKDDADVIEKILNNAMTTKLLIIKKYNIKKKGKIDNFFLELAACEIDEYVNNELIEKLKSQLYYIYQTTHQKVDIIGLDSELRDQYYFAACNSAYLKNDTVYIRYHLLTLQLAKLRDLDGSQQQYLINNYQQIFQTIDSIIKNPYQIKLTKFVTKLLPPYLILFAMFEEKKELTSEYFRNNVKLAEFNTQICNQKYKSTGKKLRSLGI